jgi:predicted AlkP superfamily pyrophosphatase or phosphodiesterase
MKPNFRKKYFFAAIVIISISLIYYLQTPKSAPPHLVLISIDGYRHDYTKMYKPTNLMKFRDSGSSATALQPIYPTKTFPNHYSIITGMYAGNHGIIGNGFYSPKRKEHYNAFKKEFGGDGTWYGGEPFWMVARKQGLITASYFWVGSDANIKNMPPNYFFAYDGFISNQTRVSQVIDWLKMPEDKRPRFITLYFSDVDTAGHIHGPNSQVVGSAIRRVDKAIGNYLKQISKLDIPINTIIVSDHGMQELDPNKIIYLSDYLDIKSYKDNKDIILSGKGTQTHLFLTKFKDENFIYNKLKKIKNATVYLKKDIPENFHIKNSERVGDIIIDANAPYYIKLDRSPSKRSFKKGTHGFDPFKTKTMNGIFYAKGPQIKSGEVVSTFENVHIFPFMAQILGIKSPDFIDGKIDALKTLIKK